MSGIRYGRGSAVKSKPQRAPDEEFELPLISEPTPKTRGTQAVKVSIFKRGDKPTSPRVLEGELIQRVSTRTIHRGTALEFARLLYRAVLYSGGILEYREWVKREREADRSLRHRLLNKPSKLSK